MAAWAEGRWNDQDYDDLRYGVIEIPILSSIPFVGPLLFATVVHGAVELWAATLLEATVLALLAAVLALDVAEGAHVFVPEAAVALVRRVVEAHHVRELLAPGAAQVAQDVDQEPHVVVGVVGLVERQRQADDADAQGPAARLGEGVHHVVRDRLAALLEGGRALGRVTCEALTPDDRRDVDRPGDRIRQAPRGRPIASSGSHAASAVHALWYMGDDATPVLFRRRASLALMVPVEDRVDFSSAEVCTLADPDGRSVESPPSTDADGARSDSSVRRGRGAYTS